MSDTPRTDAASIDNSYVDVDFARQLERELADMTARMVEVRALAGPIDLGIIAKLKAERDEARECLLDAIGFRNTDLNGYDLERWRKAAGLEEPK